MDEHKRHWNGVGYVEVSYEGRNALSSPSIIVGNIIEYFNQDPIGEEMKLKFQYREDLTDFWHRINHTKGFKLIPTELKVNGNRITCRYNIHTPDKLIAIVNTSEDTVLVWRISPKDVIDNMSPKTISVNEHFGDIFNIRRHKEYQDRLEELKSEIDNEQEVQEPTNIEIPVETEIESESELESITENSDSNTTDSESEEIQPDTPLTVEDANSIPDQDTSEMDAYLTERLGYPMTVAELLEGMEEYLKEAHNPRIEED